MHTIKCPLCCKLSFDTVLALREHLIFHVYRPIKCPCCESSSDGIFDMIDHLEKHLGYSDPSTSFESFNNFEESLKTCSHYPKDSCTNQCFSSYNKRFDSQENEFSKYENLNSQIIAQVVDDENNPTNRCKDNEEKNKVNELHSTLNQEFFSSESSSQKRDLFLVEGTRQSLSFGVSNNNFKNNLHEPLNSGCCINSTTFDKSSNYNVNKEGADIKKVSLNEDLNDQDIMGHPYIHKKFDRDLERSNSLKNDIQSYIHSFQSLLVTRLNQSMGKEQIFSSIEASIEENEPLLIAQCRSEPQPQLNSKVHSCLNDREKINGVKIHKCKLCNKIYRNKSFLRRHHSDCHTNKSHLCQKCGKKFASKGSLVNHFTIHNDRKFKCSQCSYACATPSGLRVHHFHFHSNRQKDIFQCETCKAKFKNRYTLQRHTLRRHLVQKETCKYCDKIFSCKEDLNQHIKLHLSPKTLTCDVCQQTCSTHWSLKRHKQSVHGKKGSFKCDHCDIHFTRKDSLLDHIKLFHTSVKPFRCSSCSKSFSTQSLLNSHNVKHILPKHKCDKCNKIFKYKDSLKKHQCKNPLYPVA